MMTIDIREKLPILKEISPRLVLGHIMRAGSISRADIARLTGFHRSTITRIVAALLEEGFVEESGEGDSGLGRKPVMLSLVPDAVHIMGVAIESTFVAGVLVDFNAQIIERIEVPLRDSSRDAVMTDVYWVIDSLLERARAREITVLGIGVALHGIVNSDQGLSVFAPAIEWRNEPVAANIQNKYDLPVRMDNNANAMALGESWFGYGQAVENILVVKVGSSIGSGVILGGRLFPGTNYSAGEIGHLTVLPGGPRCKCGNFGCLETVASIDAILTRGRELLKKGEGKSLRQFTRDGERLSFEQLCQATLARDSVALRLWEDVAVYLGLALSYTINILNPAKVLIGGDIFPVLDYVLPTVRETVGIQVLPPLKNHLRLEPVGLGQDSVTIGAATLLLQDIFELPKPNGLV